MANWSELLHDLLILISKRITSYEDFIAFGGVCTSWRLAATKPNFISKSPQIPWLMLAEKETNHKNLREFFIPSKGKIHKVMLPEASKRRCLSSRGWLLTIGENGVDANLMHPFSRVQIQLPSLNTFKDYELYGTYNMHYISKVILSSTPSLKSDFVVMVIWGGAGKLGFLRPGDVAWTALDTWHAQYFDVTYCEGKFYALDCTGRIVVFDVGGLNPTIGVVISVMPDGFVRLIEQLYLMESLGKFLIVSREGVQDLRLGL